MPGEDVLIMAARLAGVPRELDALFLRRACQVDGAHAIGNGVNEGLIPAMPLCAVVRPTTPRILVAASPRSTQIVSAALNDLGELLYVFTLQEALARLAEGEVDAVVAGLHFDDSLMPALLQAMRDNPATRHIPFFCCRFLPTRLKPAALAAVQEACKALSTLELIDLPAWEEQYGAAGAAARFRAVVASRLAR